MTVVGVDPHYAKPYAATVVRDGEILLQCKCTLAHLYEVVDDLRREVGPSNLLLAVEDQYMNKSYKVAKGLSWSAGKVLAVGELLGVPAQVVNVASWKSKMHAQKGTHVAASVDRGGLPDDDLASSHLIALYAVEYDGQGKPRG